MRVCICVGERTTTPYRFADLGINVYSIEELCVCIQENAYLLDDSLVNDRLVEWIDHECELHDLARVLNSMIYKKDALVRVGGPELSAKLLRLCVEKKDVRGSTGVIHYDNGRLGFTPAPH